MINNDTIRKELESENFVAIKVQSDSEAYMQFAQICKVSQILISTHAILCGCIDQNDYRGKRNSRISFFGR